MRATSSRVPAPLGVPRERPVAHDPHAAGVADEERRDDELQLVGEVVREELGQGRPAALHHEPAYAAGAEVLADPARLDRVAAVDDRRDVTEREASVLDPAARGVDELLRLAAGEEARARVELRRWPSS